jgi:three-Cys-motif partner protein
MTTRGRDGLPVRVSGPWTREKLAYVERYAGAFMKAMAPKRAAGTWDALVYLDLLAGPGRGIARDTRVEFDGSPLRALRIAPRFDRLIFGDLKPRNVEALRRRIPAPDHGRVDLRVGDCNDLARVVVATLSQ